MLTTRTSPRARRGRLMLERVTVRRRYLFILDAALLVVSFGLAVTLRFEAMPGTGPLVDAQLPLLWVSLLVRPLVYYGFGLYRRVWRYANVADLLNTVAAAVVGSAAVFVLNFGALRAIGLAHAPSYSVFAIDAMLALGFVAGIRILRKLLTQLPASSRPHAPSHHDRERVLVVGASSAGELVVRQMISDRDAAYEPVGFLDRNRVMQHMTIHGVPVLGTPAQLAEVVTEAEIDLVIIAGPTDLESLPNVVETARRLDVPVKTAGFVTSDLREYPLYPEPTRRPAPASQLEEREGGTESLIDGANFDLAVIGLGYVGLPLAIAASRVGLRVLGLDIDEQKILQLAAGRSPIEDVSDSSLRAALESGMLPTTDPALLGRADAISISVPTPLTDDLPDLSAVLAASREVGRHLVRGQLVILESTTYPGTTDEVVLPILEEESGLKAGVDFDIAYSPERIDPGNKEWSVENTPKLIGGHGVEASARAAALYGKFCTEVVTLSGTREAEMAKLLENTYRHVNIALVNEMAMFCNEMGVDIWEAIRGASTKPFGFQAFYPGPGVGGHCIPIDPGYLSYRVRQLGGEAKFVELAQEINHNMPKYVAYRAATILADAGIDIAGARVLVIGVAYKPNVADTRETPATDVVRSLRQQGARVAYADPLVESFVVDGEEVERSGDPTATAAETDLVILHTPHADIDLAAVSEAARAILDTRGMLSGPGIHRL